MKYYFLKIKVVESVLKNKCIDSLDVLYNLFFLKCCLKVFFLNGLFIVGLGIVRIIFLYMYFKEIYISFINFFKRKYCFCFVLESFLYFIIVIKFGILSISLK